MRLSVLHVTETDIPHGKKDAAHFLVDRIASVTPWKQALDKNDNFDSVGRQHYMSYS